MRMPVTSLRAGSRRGVTDSARPAGVELALLEEAQNVETGARADRGEEKIERRRSRSGAMRIRLIGPDPESFVQGVHPRASGKLDLHGFTLRPRRPARLMRPYQSAGVCPMGAARMLAKYDRDRRHNDPIPRPLALARRRAPCGGRPRLGLHRIDRSAPLDAPAADRKPVDERHRAADARLRNGGTPGRHPGVRRGRDPGEVLGSGRAAARRPLEGGRDSGALRGRLSPRSPRRRPGSLAADRADGAVFHRGPRQERLRGGAAHRRRRGAADAGDRRAVRRSRRGQPRAVRPEARGRRKIRARPSDRGHLQRAVVGDRRAGPVLRGAGRRRVRGRGPGRRRDRGPVAAPRQLFHAHAQGDPLAGRAARHGDRRKGRPPRDLRGSRGRRQRRAAGGRGAGRRAGNRARRERPARRAARRPARRAPGRDRATADRPLRLRVLRTPGDLRHDRAGAQGRVRERCPWSGRRRSRRSTRSRSGPSTPRPTAPTASSTTSSGASWSCWPSGRSSPSRRTASRGPAPVTG